jgi:hypothetical protein
MVHGMKYGAVPRSVGKGRLAASTQGAHLRPEGPKYMSVNLYFKIQKDGRREAKTEMLYYATCSVTMSVI